MSNSKYLTHGDGIFLGVILVGLSLSTLYLMFETSAIEKRLDAIEAKESQHDTSQDL